MRYANEEFEEEEVEEGNCIFPSQLYSCFRTQVALWLIFESVVCFTLVQTCQMLNAKGHCKHVSSFGGVLLLLGVVFCKDFYGIFVSGSSG